MIELKNVSKYYYQNGMIASGFTKINLKFNIGEFVVITGESGSGKSTLLNVISGLDSYEEGEMYINGEETSHYTEADFEDYRRKYIGNIFQNFNLVNSYTVYQNIELVLLLNGEKKKDIKGKVLEIIDTVGLKKFKNTKVSKLSGGQKQRVAIARALAKETPIIVADEPTGNLDTRSANSIMKLLHEISKDKLVVIVTHNKEQVEEYATRLITMNDGRVVEDKTVTKIKNEIKPEIKQYKNLTIPNRFRLGIRNTFNIFTKFALIFIVFLFMSMTFIYTYSNSKKNEKQVALLGGNSIFNNSDTKRIILKKKDKTEMTKDDFEYLRNIEHVKSLEENDILLDTYVVLTDEKTYSYVPGMARNIKDLEEEVTYGRMPENDDEIVVIASYYDWFFETPEDVLDTTFKLKYNYSSGDEYVNVKVVGIIKSKDTLNYNNYLYVADKVLDHIRFVVNQQYSDTTTYFLSKYNSYQTISPSNNVAKGTIVLSEDVNYSCDNFNCKNKLYIIVASNIYYRVSLDLMVADTYNKNTISKYTSSAFEEVNGTVYINTEDYNSLYNKGIYQSSVFVDDEDNLAVVTEELENNGYKALVIKDTLVNSARESLVALQLFRTFVMAFLIVALFFISYFVIKVILKSRSIYFTTIRILGSSRRIAKQILDIELFTNATFAYIVWMVCIYLTKVGIIQIKQVKDLLPYITIKECIIIYIILAVMSQLISNRFARKIFKQTVMKTYREEAM